MIFVIPMAGHGRRFTAAGYTVPKYLLEAHGKTLLEWSVNSLPLELASLTIFVILREHEKAFRMEAKIRGLYKHQTPLAFIFLDEVTRGQAETIMFASSKIKPHLPLVIFNIDTMFSSATIKENLLRTDIDGVLGCFPSIEPRFSFASTDPNGRVICVKEKEPISNNALTGFYHFRRASDFLEIADEAIKRNQLTKGEFYVAPLYNKMIDRGSLLILDYAPVHHILGTPEEYTEFAGMSFHLTRQNMANSH